MLDLGKIRDEIDATDDEIVRLFQHRMALTAEVAQYKICLLYTSPSPRDPKTSRMPSSA